MIRLKDIMSVIVGINLLMMLMVSSVYAMDTSKFFEAGIDYKNGDYEEAIRLYEEIIADGEISGNLYYNLGNAYFKAGKLGKSILNYKRARRLIPLDSDLQANYTYVLSLVKEVNADKEKFVLVKMANSYVQKLTLNDMTTICLAIYATIGAYVFISLFLSIGRRRVFIISLILLSMLSFHLSVLVVEIKSQEGLSIITERTDAAFEPTSASTVHFKLPEGVQVRMIGYEGEWVKIKRSDGKMGWVQGETIEKI